MKIGMLIARFPPIVGGTENQCFQLSAELVRRGHSVTVLTEQAQPGLSLREKRDGVDIVRFATGTRSPSSFSYTIQSFRFLQKNDPFEILHAHMIATPAAVAITAGRFQHRPVLVKVAGGGRTGDIQAAGRTLKGSFKLNLFRRMSPHVVCPSVQTREELVAFGLPPDHVAFIPNGVDGERFRPVSREEKQEARRALHLPDAPVAIYAGRAAAGKGVEHLLAAWNDANGPRGWYLLLVLAREIPPAIEADLRKNNPFIHVLRDVSDMTNGYRAADAAVLLSDAEGLSNFLLESISSGLPLVTSPGACLADAPWNKVVPNRTPQEVREALDTIQRTLSLGNDARRYAEQHFSFQMVVSQYEALYEKLSKNKLD